MPELFLSALQTAIADNYFESRGLILRQEIENQWTVFDRQTEAEVTPDKGMLRAINFLKLLQEIAKEAEETRRDLMNLMTFTLLTHSYEKFGIGKLRSTVWEVCQKDFITPDGNAILFENLTEYFLTRQLENVMRTARDKGVANQDMETRILNFREKLGLLVEQNNFDVQAVIEEMMMIVTREVKARDFFDYDSTTAIKTYLREIKKVPIQDDQKVSEIDVSAIKPDVGIYRALNLLQCLELPEIPPVGKAFINFVALTHEYKWFGGGTLRKALIEDFLYACPTVTEETLSDYLLEITLREITIAYGKANLPAKMAKERIEMMRDQLGKQLEHAGFETGQLNTILVELLHSACQINPGKVAGESEVAVAARNGYVTRVDDLLQQGADVNAAVRGFARGGYVKLVTELCAKYKNLIDMHEVARGFAAGGYVEEVEKCIAQYGASYINDAAYGYAEGGLDTLIQTMKSRGADQRYVERGAAERSQFFHPVEESRASNEATTSQNTQVHHHPPAVPN